MLYIKTQIEAPNKFCSPDWFWLRFELNKAVANQHIYAYIAKQSKKIFTNNFPLLIDLPSHLAR